MRVVIAEDLFLLREGLVRLLTAHGFDVVAAVASAPELLRALLDERPDVGIVDVRLPPSHTDDGLRAALQARRQVPGLPVLVLSQYVEQLYARELLADAAGGVGYLLKDRVFNDDQFVDAIRAVAGGGTVMDTEVVAKLLGRHAREEPIGRLSGREREVLGLMAEGRSNIAIARGLTEEKILATMDFENSGMFDEREKAALRFATKFKEGDDAIDSDAVYDDLKKHFSEEEIIELALLCAQTDGVGKFARSLQMRTWEEACNIQPMLRAPMKKLAAK